MEKTSDMRAREKALADLNHATRYMFAGEIEKLAKLAALIAEGKMSVWRVAKLVKDFES